MKIIFSSLFKNYFSFNSIEVFLKALSKLFLKFKKKIIFKNPNYFSFYFKKATSYYCLGLLDKSLNYFQLCLSLKKKNKLAPFLCYLYSYLFKIFFFKKKRKKMFFILKKQILFLEKNNLLKDYFFMIQYIRCVIYIEFFLNKNKAFDFFLNPRKEWIFQKKKSFLKRISQKEIILYNALIFLLKKDFEKSFFFFKNLFKIFFDFDEFKKGPDYIIIPNSLKSIKGKTPFFDWIQVAEDFTLVLMLSSKFDYYIEWGKKYSFLKTYSLYYYQFKALYHLKRFAEAKSLISLLLKGNKKNPFMYFYFAVTFFFLKDYNRSTYFFFKVIRLKKNFYQAYYNLAVLHHKYNLIKTAEKFYRISLKILSSHREKKVLISIILYNLGILYYQKGNLVKSFCYLKKSFNYYPRKESKAILSIIEQDFLLGSQARSLPYYNLKRLFSNKTFLYFFLFIIIILIFSFCLFYIF